MKAIFRSTALFLLLSLLPAVALHAQDDTADEAVSYYQKDRIALTAEGTAVANTGQGWEAYYFAVQPYFQVDTTRLTAYTGMQLTKGTFDLTGGVGVYPLVGRNGRAGFFARYNLNYYDDTSLAHNVLVGTDLAARGKWFGIKATVAALIKNRSIFSIDSDRTYLPSICQAFSVEADVYFPFGMTFYLSVASYERYRYMMAVAPSFTAGIKQEIYKNFYVGLEGAVRYTDFFTSSTFYDGCEIRLSVGRTF